MAPDGRMTVVYGIHTFGLLQGHHERLAEMVHSDRARAEADPLRTQILMLGDLNFLESGDTHHKLNRPDLPPPAVPAAVRLQDLRSHPRAVPWRPLMSQFIEIRQTHDTHYDAGSQTSSRIDRIYMLRPAWAFIMPRIQTMGHHDPFDLHVRDISDHAPISFEFMPTDKKRSDELPIFRSVLRHPSFHENLAILVGSASPADFTPPLWPQSLKSLARIAAQWTREIILDIGEKKFEKRNLAQRLSTMSRMITANDIKLYNRLCQVSPLVVQHVHLASVASAFDPERQVPRLVFNDADAFAKAFDEARLFPGQ